MSDLTTNRYAIPYANPDDPLGGIAATTENMAETIDDILDARTIFPVNSLTTAAPSFTGGTWVGWASGIVYTAPPTGRVLIHLDLVMDFQLTANALREFRLGYELREGNVVGSGDLVQDPSITRSVRTGLGSTSGMRQMSTSTRIFPTPTLNGGQQYNVRRFIWINSTASFSISYIESNLRIQRN